MAGSGLILRVSTRCSAFLCRSFTSYYFAPLCLHSSIAICLPIWQLRRVHSSPRSCVRPPRRSFCLYLCCTSMLRPTLLCAYGVASLCNCLARFYMPDSPRRSQTLSKSFAVHFRQHESIIAGPCQG